MYIPKIDLGVRLIQIFGNWAIARPLMVQLKILISEEKTKIIELNRQLHWINCARRWRIEQIPNSFVRLFGARVYDIAEIWVNVTANTSRISMSPPNVVWFETIWLCLSTRASISKSYVISLPKKFHMQPHGACICFHKHEFCLDRTIKALVVPSSIISLRLSVSHRTIDLIENVW